MLERAVVLRVVLELMLQQQDQVVAQHVPPAHTQQRDLRDVQPVLRVRIPAQEQAVVAHVLLEPTLPLDQVDAPLVLLELTPLQALDLVLHVRQVLIPGQQDLHPVLLVPRVNILQLVQVFVQHALLELMLQLLVPPLAQPAQLDLTHRLQVLLHVLLVLLVHMRQQLDLHRVCHARQEHTLLREPRLV